MKKLIGGVIAALVCVMLNFSVNAQDNNLNKNNNLNGRNSDSLNHLNPRSPQSDQDIQTVPMDNTVVPTQTSKPGNDGSVPANYPKQATPPRMNRNVQDSTKIH